MGGKQLRSCAGRCPAAAQETRICHLMYTSSHHTNCTSHPRSHPCTDEGNEAAAWFSHYLGLPCRLVRYAGQPGREAGPPEGDPYRRVVDTDWAPIGSGAETAFTDGFPFLLANEKSLEELNSQLAYKGEEELPMNRFRPNFVVRVVPGCWPTTASKQDAHAASSLGRRNTPVHVLPVLQVSGARAFAEDKWSTVCIGGSGPDGEGGIEFDR